MTRIQSARLLILALLIGLLAACARPEEPPPRVAVILSGDARLDKLNGLRAGLAELGYVEGDDLILEVHNAANDQALLTQLVDEAAASQPDIIIALGGRETKVAKAATADNKIPVVFIGADSAVNRGLVESMARSGNNLTGIESNFTGLIPKRMEMLTRLLPEARRVTVFYLPIVSPQEVPPDQRRENIVAQAAEDMGMAIQLIPIDNIDELTPLAEALQPGDTDAIFLVPSAPILTALPDVLAPAAMRAGIPILGMDRDLIYPGVLAAQGPSLYEMGRQVARLVDKILRGVPPGDIPIEFPNTIDLVLDLDTAQQLGITIPDDILALATEVILSGGGE